MERHEASEASSWLALSAAYLASALTISLCSSFPLPPPEPEPVQRLPCTARPQHGPRPGEHCLADLPVVSALTGAGVPKIVRTWGNRKDIFHVI